jgi:sulfur carrier protein
VEAPQEESATLMVNGVARPWRPGFDVASLLEELDATGFGVAVERNGEVVRRAAHAATVLEPGDRIEVVRLVGGG